MSDQATPASGARPMTRRELEAKIIAKAWRDPKFKKRLLENPHATVQNELREVDPSIVLPAALQVQVHVEKPNVYHLVVPRNPKDIPLGDVLGDDLVRLAAQTAAVATIVNATTMVNPVNVVVANVNVALVGNANVI